MQKKKKMHLLTNISEMQMKLYLLRIGKKYKRLNLISESEKVIFGNTYHWHVT